MRKEIVLCDSCNAEITDANAGSSPSPLSGEGQNGRAFAFDLTFHPTTHGSAPRSGVSKPGPKPDLCTPCALSIIASALKASAPVEEAA